MPDREASGALISDDAGTVVDGEEPLAEPVYGSVWRWLAAVILIFLLIGGLRAGGDAIYDPPSRLPDPRSFTRDRNLFGATESILDEIEAIEALAAAGPPFELIGEAYELALPRTLADRLFGERRERALVFAAQTSTGSRSRFLILSDGKSSPVYAVESLRYRQNSTPGGIFIAIPIAPSFEGLIARLSTLSKDARAQVAKEYSAEDFTLFGPFAGGGRALQQRIARNMILGHLAASLDAKRADVSMAAGLFLITRSREGGTVRGVYQPQFGVILEPLWESGQTSTLAHELVHAYMDEVEPEPVQKRELAARHFEASHPRLFGEVLSESYEHLDARGRAEEAMANIVGALAEGEVSTEPAGAILRSRAVAETSEPILTADVVLLVRFGLLPECMSPDSLGYDLTRITFAYHDLVSERCS